MKAQNIIRGELLATVDMYMVEPISSIRVDKKVIRYFFIW